MSKIREKFGHVTCTLFDNVAFISNCIDDVTAKHAVTYYDLSRHVLEKSLINAKSNKAVNALLDLATAKLQISYFCCIKLH